MRRIASPDVRPSVAQRGVGTALVFAALGLAAGCSENSTGPDYPNIDPIVFSQHVQPILSGSCAVADCHDTTTRQSGLALETYQQVAEGSDFGAMLVPFKPDKSHLYLHVAGEIEPQMPFEGDPLPDDEIAFLARWIEVGAPDDGGTAMYSDVTRKAFVACQGENTVAVVDLETGLTARYLDVHAPHSVFVDRTARRLYVSRFEDATDNVRIYDADTHVEIASGRAGTFPALMGMPPEGGQLWVTNFSTPGSDDHKVRVLDPTTLEVTMEWGNPSVGQPHGLTFSEDDRHLVFLTGILTDNILVFDTGLGRGASPTFALLSPFPLPEHAGVIQQQPQQCVLSDDGSRLFASALESDMVHVLDVSDLDALDAAILGDSTDAMWTNSIEVGDGPWHMALSPDGNELWVANWIGKSVTVLDVSNPDAVTVIETLAPMMGHGDHMMPIFQRPIGIAFSPDGSQVWVANANDDLAGGGHHPEPEGEKPPGSVAVVDATTREIVQVTEVPNFARFVDFLP